MELDNIIENLQNELNRVNEYKADYCSVAVEDVEAIIEYLEQLKVITCE